MLKAVDKLPKGSETCVVAGGNHRGFASYSHQPLDWEVSKAGRNLANLAATRILENIVKRHL